MGRVTRRMPVLRIDLDGNTTRRPDVLAAEEPLEIRLNGEPFTVTMRTPGHDVELAHGLLRSEGLVAAATDIGSAVYCVGSRDEDGTLQRNEYNVLDVTLTDPQARVPVSGQRSLLMHGGCGLCGKTGIDAVAATMPRALSAQLGPRCTPEQVAGLPGLLRDGQQIFRRTGGTHAAGLVVPDEDRVLVVREDVGRHNAVDKVLGWAMMNEADTERAVLVTSSRASFELVQKAAMSGVTWLVAVSAPSSLAVQAAQDLGVTLVGFVRGRSLNVYANAERLASSP